MDFPSSLLMPPSQHHMPGFPLPDDRKRFFNPSADFLPPFGPLPPSSSAGASPFFPSLFSMGAPPIPPPPSLPSSSSSSRRSGISGDPSKLALFPQSMSTPFDFGRGSLLPPGFPMPTNNHLEADRYRFLFEQQARERDLQFAMMAAAANGSGQPPPPPLFTDPSSAALFKHC